ncbi:hypothetical protein BDZ91DRAFT_790070 [Kalaharituber pfeilii]|nr:hypothetical protein BDZ91DRAFT_790070 [Kalaharituber pfeilii]
MSLLAALGGEVTPRQNQGNQPTGQSGTAGSETGARRRGVVKRSSPRKVNSRTIPGSRVANGRFCLMPKGMTMELLQARDMEITRLVEEIQDYEDEATVLSHELYVAGNENSSLRMQIQEMSKDMVGLQRAYNDIRLAITASGPNVKYRSDADIKTIWDRLVRLVIDFATDHCIIDDDADYDPFNSYRTPQLNGTFELFCGSELDRNKIPIIYIHKVTHGVPARLDQLLYRHQDLIAASIIMDILTDEVFDKVRYLIRSEPFWDPMKAAFLQNPTQDEAGNLVQPAGTYSTLTFPTTEDLLLQQESRADAHNQTAFEFQSLRAKMLLHLTQQQGGFQRVFANYLDRVGVLIVNAIYPYFTRNVLNTRLLGFLEKGQFNSAPQGDVKVEDLFTGAKPQLQTLQRFSQIITIAGALAIMMRSDHTITYLDKGGWNLGYNPELMENAVRHTRPYRDGTVAQRRDLAQAEDRSFVWLVVAPALRRTGNENGGGYNESRILSRSAVAVRNGTPEQLSSGTDPVQMTEANT